MGFLEHLNGAFKNNRVEKSNTQKSFLGLGFNSQALKKYNLKQDTFAHSNENLYATEPTSDYNLALIQPVRFIKKYLNDETIQKAIATNPTIERILKENGLNCEYNLENVSSIMMSHLIPTSKTAQKMYKAMGHKEGELSYLHLTQAALLHDIGKIFIPKEILNKRGKLSPKERLIVELHNQLSYEILKTTDLNPIVAKLTYEHHNYNKDVKRNQENQALTISDVFCALKEDRPYKKPITDLCAKAILYDMGTKGSFDTRYISYLTA